MPTLYIVATPIGNLEDITMRALRVLGEVDFVLCEDTRITKRLLDHYGIGTPTISYHQHSDLNKTEYLLDLLAQGRDLALVSDAGTPGISDPGGKLVAAVIERFDPDESDVCVESVPGPSAVTAALSISGIPTDKFIFMGFPPHKKGRQKFLRQIAQSGHPVVIYESKHRIIKFLEELESLNKSIIEDNQRIAENERQGGFIKKKNEEDQMLHPFTSVVVCREISKMHETVYRGDLERIISLIQASNNDQKGEFTVVIGR